MNYYLIKLVLFCAEYEKITITAIKAENEKSAWIKALIDESHTNYEQTNEPEWQNHEKTEAVDGDYFYRVYSTKQITKQDYNFYTELTNF